jgi:hypothetical protein
MAVENADLGVYLHLTYQGKIYYISDAARTTTFTYFPFLAKSPDITYGGTGFARVQSGSISILRYVEDYPNIHYNDHPFVGTRYISLLTQVQEIPFELYLGDRYLPIFSGTLTLDSVTENTLEFSVQEEEFEQGCLFPILDQEKSEVSDIKFQKVSDNEHHVVVYVNQNIYTTDDRIIFAENENYNNLETSGLIFKKSSPDYYNISDVTEFTFKLLSEKTREYITLESIGLTTNDIELEDSIENIWKLTSNITQQYYIGFPRFNPFSFGYVKIRNPLISAGSTNYINALTSEITLSSIDATNGIRFKDLDGYEFSVLPKIYGKTLKIYTDFNVGEIGFSKTLPTIEAFTSAQIQTFSDRVELYLDQMLDENNDPVDIYCYDISDSSNFIQINFEIADNFYLINNPSINVKNGLLKLYDDGVDITENVSILNSNEKFLALKNTPVGELGISGNSLNGITVQEFFNLICRYLNGSEVGKVIGIDEIDMEYLDSTADFSLAPYAFFHMFPYYIDSEKTAIEIATEVANSINYQFYFKRYRDPGSTLIKKKMYVIDINTAFEETVLHPHTTSKVTGKAIPLEEILESDQIKIDLTYQFPVKAIETTITVNRLYQAAEGEVRNQSKMQPQDVTFRIGVHTIGNIITDSILSNDIEDGIPWLSRKALKNILPTCNLIVRDIREDISLGSKVRVVDDVREVIIDILVEKIGYDFIERKTTLSGIGEIIMIEDY